MDTGRILFVDDTFSPHIWKSTMIDVCTSGEAAIELLEKNKYTFVSLDYDMPGLTGLGLLQEGRWNEYKVPFINIHSIHPNAHKMVQYIKDKFDYRCIIFTISKNSLPDDSAIHLNASLAIKHYGDDIAKWSSPDYIDRQYVELAKGKLIYRVRKHYSEKISTRTGYKSQLNIRSSKEYIEHLLSNGYEITYNPFGNYDCCCADLRHSTHSAPVTVTNKEMMSCQTR